GLRRPYEHPSSRHSTAKQIGIFASGAELRVEGAIELLQNLPLEQYIASAGYAPVNHRPGLEARTLEHLSLHRPGRRTYLEFWDNRTQDSIRAVLEKDLVARAQPAARRLFVVIDERYQFPGRHGHGRVTGHCNALLWLDSVGNGNTRSLRR